MMLMDVVTALGGAGVGATVLKLVEMWLTRDKDNTDVATKIRDELRGDMDKLRARIESLEEALKNKDEEYDELETKHLEMKYEFQKYKLDVYRILIENHAPPELLEKVQAL